MPALHDSRRGRRRVLVGGLGMLVALGLTHSFLLAQDKPAAEETAPPASPSTPAPVKSDGLPPQGPARPPGQGPADRRPNFVRPMRAVEEPADPAGPKDRPNRPFANKVRRPDGRQRERIELLARLPASQILAELQKWGPFNSMSLGEQGALLTRIQEIKDRRREVALNKAREMGLNLPPERQEEFETRYWTLHIEMDKKLWKEFEPRRRAMESDIASTLTKEFAVAKPEPAPTPAATNVAPTPPASPQ